jgi:hypothetical protein
MIERKADNGDVYKRVFIHFDKWFNNVDAVATRQRLISGKDIKIVYDNPWFWKVSANRSTEIKDNRTRTRTQVDELPRAPCLGRPELLPRAPCLALNIDRRPEKRDDRRDERRDERMPVNSSIPKLVLKVPVPLLVEPVFIPRSPSSSPPRQRPKTEHTPEKIETEDADTTSSDIPTFDDMYSDLL